MVTPTTERSEMGNIGWVGVSVYLLSMSLQCSTFLSPPPKEHFTQEMRNNTIYVDNTIIDVVGLSREGKETGRSSR